MNLRALDLTVDQADGTRLQKDILKRKLRKLARRGDIGRMTPLFLYRYCAARMSLGDFSDYTGWEWRSDDGWSAKMLYEPQPLPRWKGHYIERLWIIGEQGIGDEIFYASILPECLMRVKEVVFECDPRLHTILLRSFPRLVCVPRQSDWKGRSGEFLPAADLLRFFRRDVKHFPGKPYLRVDPDRAAGFALHAGRTGVAWRGRQGSMDPFRLDLDDPLSLQYGEQCGIESPNIDLTQDIDGVFALVSVLGRVVTVPQTIHHIAGCIGKRVDVILPEIPGEVRNQIAWDYPLGKLPWYPDVTVYRLNEWKDKASRGRTTTNTAGRSSSKASMTSSAA